MKKILSAIVLALMLLSVQAAELSYNGVKPTLIIDVRTPGEFAAGHIAGAVNIPFDQIGQGIQSIKGLQKEEPILLYCRSGRRSAIARMTLEQQGYSRILDGGGMDTLAKSLKACTAKTC